MNKYLDSLLHHFQLPLQNPVLVFSLILAIILLSPILLKRLNIPGIIGLIISGVIIGPHGLHLLDKNSAIDLFSTIGLLYIIQQAALSVYGPEARPVAPPFNYRVLLPWFGYSGYKLAVIGASVVLLVTTWLVLTRTRIGLVMRATQYDRETAQAFGIPVDRVYGGVFALGAMLAAVAAVLIVPIQQAHYLMGRDPLLLSFIVVIIGGLGSLRGTVIAALLIGLSDGIISMFFSPTLAKMIATLVVALVLVFRPQGLFGTTAR